MDNFTSYGPCGSQVSGGFGNGTEGPNPSNAGSNPAMGPLNNPYRKGKK